MDKTLVPAHGNESGFAPVNWLVRLHRKTFSALDAIGSGWFTGLAARLAFASTLFLYYLNSATGKLGEGVFGFLDLDVGAYVSIWPKAMEAVNYDPSALSFFPHHLIVYLGTWAEILLPLMIVAGLFARIASLGMVVFITVQSYVDVTQHGLDEKFVGAMFDRFPDAIIWDQRLFWAFLLVIIIIHGPGKISMDHLLARWWK